MDHLVRSHTLTTCLLHTVSVAGTGGGPHVTVEYSWSIPTRRACEWLAAASAPGATQGRPGAAWTVFARVECARRALESTPPLPSSPLLPSWRFLCASFSGGQLLRLFVASRARVQTS